MECVMCSHEAVGACYQCGVGLCQGCGPHCSVACKHQWEHDQDALRGAGGE